jgi:YgiT-type zinc finger domain-containing protein
MRETKEDISGYYPCEQCHAGNLQPRRLTYFTWIGNQLISVPHFPAWVCDVCGRREYDMKAVMWLDMLLDPNAGKPTQKRRNTPPALRPRTGAFRPLRDS